MGLRGNAEARSDAAAFLASAKARFGFITVGSPQQEMIANEAREMPGAGGVVLCVGAGLEFLTGDQQRAPRPLQRLGLEWAYRLYQEPARLARRYGSNFLFALKSLTRDLLARGTYRDQTRGSRLPEELPRAPQAAVR